MTILVLHLESKYKPYLEGLGGREGWKVGCYLVELVDDSL